MFSRNGPQCTTPAVLAQYDAALDGPIARELLQILATHPADALSGILLTVRDPLDWVRSRRRHKDLLGQPAVPTAGCPGVSATALGNETLSVAREYVLYNAIAACAAISLYGPDKLFVANLFREEPARLRERLWDFLTSRPNFLRPRMRRGLVNRTHFEAVWSASTSPLCRHELNRRWPAGSIFVSSCVPHTAR